MRNTTMRDKLADLLTSGLNTQLETQSNDAVLSAVRAIQRKPAKKVAVVPKSKAKSAKKLTRHAVSPEVLATAPRYMLPSKRKNPFAVHVYPVPNLEVPPDETVVSEVKTPVAVVPEPPLEVSGAMEQPVKLVAAPESQTKEPSKPTEEIHLVPDTVSAPVLAVQSKQESAETPVLAAISEVVPFVSGSIKQDVDRIVLSSLTSETVAVPAVGQPQSGETPLQEPSTSVSIAFPPNLGWLEKSTPFDNSLRDMVEQLRSAKTNVVFTLEQSTLRQNELKTQIAGLKSNLDKEEYLGEQQRDYLRQIDDVIAACALVAEQSAGVEAVLRQSVNAKKHHEAHAGIRKTGESRRWSLDDPTACHRSDVVNFFKNHVGTNWTAPEIITEFPVAKRVHAKRYLNVVLAALYKDGLVQRVGPGIYRWIEAAQ